MPRKSALIVDDSKSARVLLSRMLETHDIEVDMAESAEQAIEYLQHNRPDAIFMDHQMPGMDGLQAVKAIKGNPQTAMIPIMMYTSQEGELYVGEARALGALGVLPKQLHPIDVSKVMYELHLLPDRRVPKDPAAKLAAAETDQTLELRRFIAAHLDATAQRIIADLRGAAPAPDAVPALDSTTTPTGAAPKAGRPWTAVACLAAVIFGALWLAARDELARSRAEVAGLTASNVESAHARQELAETIRDLTGALASTPASPVGAAGSPLLPRTELVPYGEIPLDRARIDALREIVGKLEAQGFRGIVRVTSSAGSFCLSGNATDGYVPANAALPASKCDLVGNPLEESAAGQQRQSLAFANLIAGIRQRSGGAISVAIDNAGPARSAVPYPARTEALTAGEWNKAAAANNRVEFTAEAAAAP